ncbi:hypothetical protein [Candidatus Finniella inopinata]|uniref:Uncharacterized protein n=1 Tax=Candidatus Finniella inopinata TaxID=1696036 RepID=A0A4V2DZW1_9PROT|nr:hypothetical protein [Candidatus Finniella inopinata]RZI46437.1 hypothetical protein EQU50_02270 [Candidatus Finniella inopinata]
MKKILCFFCVFLLSVDLHASSSSSSSGYVGPFLNFIDAGAGNDQWNVSALVVAPTSIPNSDLSLNIGGSKNPISPQLIDTINGQQFWRYRLSFPRDNISAKVTYQIGSGTAFTVDIPARKTDPHVFFGTCNEYSKPTSIWQKINKTHDEKPFHLGILDGDQVYLDMGWGNHNAGVFGLESVKQVMIAYSGLNRTVIPV